MRRATRLLSVGLVQAPCGSERSPAATNSFSPLYTTWRRGDSVQSSARIVATAGEYPNSRDDVSGTDYHVVTEKVPSGAHCKEPRALVLPRTQRRNQPHELGGCWSSS